MPMIPPRERWGGPLRRVRRKETKQNACSMLHTVHTSAAGMRPICIMLHRIYMYIASPTCCPRCPGCMLACLLFRLCSCICHIPSTCTPCLPLGNFLQLVLLHCGEFAEDQVAPRGIGKLGRQVHPGEMTFFGDAAVSGRHNPTRQVHQGASSFPWVEARS